MSAEAYPARAVSARRTTEATLRVVRLLAAAATAVYLVALVAGPRTHLLWRECALQVLALVLITAYPALRAMTSREGRAWLVPMTGWLGLFALGNLIQNAHSDPAAASSLDSIATPIYMLCYPCGLAVVLLAHRRVWRIPEHGELLDTVVAAGTLAAVFASFVVPAASAAARQGGDPVWLVLTMPIMDFAVQALTLAALILIGSRPQQVSGWLFAGIACFALADTYWAVAQAAGTWRTGTVLDGVWVIGCTAIGLGAGAGAGPRRTTHAWGVAALAIPLTAATVALGILTWGNRTRLPTLGVALAVGALLSALLRLVHAYRQVFTLAETRRQARTDLLTGLGNRRVLQEALDAALRRLPDAPFVLALADLDGFKVINDRHGHVAGDEVLREVAARMADALPSEAVLTRLGGDEFAAVIPLSADGPDALRRSLEHTAEQVRASIELTGQEPGLTVTVGVSFGVAGGVGRSAAELLRRADTAMYDAKRAGAVMREYVETPVQRELGRQPDV